MTRSCWWRSSCATRVHLCKSWEWILSLVYKRVNRETLSSSTSASICFLKWCACVYNFDFSYNYDCNASYSCLVSSVADEIAECGRTRDEFEDNEDTMDSVWWPCFLFFLKLWRCSWCCYYSYYYCYYYYYYYTNSCCEGRMGWEEECVSRALREARVDDNLIDNPSLSG